MRPRTTSREESVRVLLLLFTPIILFNAWILALHLLQRANPDKAETKMTFKMVLEFFHVACPEKNMPVFANAVTFAVVASEIAAASI